MYLPQLQGRGEEVSTEKERGSPAGPAPVSKVNCGFPCQAGGLRQEEAHLPHPGVREDLSKDLAAARSRALAHGRAPFCLQLGFLWEALHT